MLRKVWLRREVVYRLNRGLTNRKYIALNISTVGLLLRKRRKRERLAGRRQEDPRRPIFISEGASRNPAEDMPLLAKFHSN
jgi:hypothetical protein